MSEPVFLKPARGLSLDEIATLTGASAPAAPARSIANIAPLDRAGPSDLTFFDNPRYAAAAATTHAGACLTTAALAGKLPGRTAVLVVHNPYRAFVAVARALFPHALRPSSLYPAGTAPGAQVHPERAAGKRRHRRARRGHRAARGDRRRHGDRRQCRYRPAGAHRPRRRDRRGLRASVMP